MPLTKLVVRGARQHNLKNISVEIPRNTLTVITGLSGSGKSSLAFDTIYAEGQRRYVESLSAYARQFLDQMERPDVDVIEGLSPSIAIEQKTTTRSPRSTVGTITEIYDYLRVIYSSIGIPHCPQCGNPITRQSSEQIVQSILTGELCKTDDRVMILAPIVRGRKGAYRKELEKLAQDGYLRARINGELVQLDEIPVLDKRKNHTIEVVVDRLLVKPGIAARLEQSIATALKLASGLVTVSIVGGADHVFSEKLACPDCGISVPQLEPRSFSFNSPYGACPACNGLGSKYDFDPARVIVDWTTAALRRRPRPRIGLCDAEAHPAARRLRARIRSRNAVREIAGRHAKFGPIRISSVEQCKRVGRQESEDGRKRLSLPGHPQVSRSQFSGIELRFVPRMDDAIHVGDALHGLPWQAPSSRIARGEARQDTPSPNSQGYR